jgi:hypothetical protein
LWPSDRGFSKIVNFDPAGDQTITHISIDKSARVQTEILLGDHRARGADDNSRGRSDRPVSTLDSRDQRSRSVAFRDACDSLPATDATLPGAHVAGHRSRSNGGMGTPSGIRRPLKTIVQAANETWLRRKASRILGIDCVSDARLSRLGMST